MKPYFVIFCFISMILVAGCGSAEATEPTPPTVHYGEDICVACGMIISDARFAAAYVTADGTGHKFDEIGGMLTTYLAQPDEVAALFVHDYEDQSWLRAEAATYVFSQDLITPMAFGLVALASPDRAAALAQEVGGEVLSFEEALAIYGAENERLVDEGNSASETAASEAKTDHHHSHGE